MSSDATKSLVILLINMQQKEIWRDYDKMRISEKLFTKYVREGADLKLVRNPNMFFREMYLMYGEKEKEGIMRHRENIILEYKNRIIPIINFWFLKISRKEAKKVLQGYIPKDVAGMVLPYMSMRRRKSR